MNCPRAPHGLREDSTDLNCLFYLQQVARSLADKATTIEAREVHEALARRYEEQIEQLTGQNFHFPSHR